MMGSRFKSGLITPLGSVSRRDLVCKGAQALGVMVLLPDLLAREARGQVASTFDYYISPTGSNSNPGTQSSPWAITSLQDTNPNNAKLAGKRIGLLSGTYNVAGITSGSSPDDYQHPALHIPAGATVQSVTPRGAILSVGGSSSTNSVIGQNPNGSGNWTLDGVVINGGGYFRSLIQTYPGGGAGPITIQNCEIYGINATVVGDNDAGVYLTGANNAVVRNNYFHDIHKPDQSDHCHGYLEYNCSGSQVVNNTFSNCDTGVDGKVGASGAIIAYNYFYKCGFGSGMPAAVQGYDGGQEQGTATNSIHNNVFDGCGPTRQCDVATSIVQATTWYNNTIYNTQSGSVALLDLRTGSGRLVQSYNNICVATANGSGNYYGTVAQSGGGFSVCDYNDYYFGSYAAAWGLSGQSTYSSLGAWQAASGGDSHSSVSNPQFASNIVSGSGPAQFKLASGSPCISAGRSNGTSAGSTCDMGAWGNGATSIGCSFAPGATQSTSVPDAPTLTVS